MEDFELEEYEDDEYLSQFIDEEEIKKVGDFVKTQTEEEIEDDLTFKDDNVKGYFDDIAIQVLNNNFQKKREVKWETDVNPKVKIDHNSFERVKSYRPIAEAASKETGVPVNLLLGQIYQESRGKNVVSSAGASGVSQFMPATARQYGVDVNDVTSSINGQARYMRDLYKHYGDWNKATMAYNAGQGRIDNYYKGKGKPLAKETLDYLPLVNQAASRFQTGGYAQSGIKYNNQGQPYIEQEQFKIDNSRGYVPVNPQYTNTQNFNDLELITPKNFNGYDIDSDKMLGDLYNDKIDFKPNMSVTNNSTEKNSNFLNFINDKGTQNAITQVTSLVQPALELGRDFKDFKARSISKGTSLANIVLNAQESKRKRLQQIEDDNLDLDFYNSNSNNQIKSKSALT